MFYNGDRVLPTLLPAAKLPRSSAHLPLALALLLMLVGSLRPYALVPPVPGRATR
jgi:hypothetical protein